jgi:protein phosphatase 2C family protein 2/3
MNKNNVLLGPVRVLPGRLSVSRTFGDIEAKDIQFGGKPGVIVAEPEIKQFRVQADHDFILMGCDGIFDKLTNREIIELVW